MKSSMSQTASVLNATKGRHHWRKALSDEYEWLRQASKDRLIKSGLSQASPHAGQKSPALTERTKSPAGPAASPTEGNNSPAGPAASPVHPTAEPGRLTPPEPVQQGSKSKEPMPAKPPHAPQQKEAPPSPEMPQEGGIEL